MSEVLRRVHARNGLNIASLPDRFYVGVTGAFPVRGQLAERAFTRCEVSAFRYELTAECIDTDGIARLHFHKKIGVLIISADWFNCSGLALSSLCVAQP